MIRFPQAARGWPSAALLLALLTAGSALASNHGADLYPFDDPVQRLRFWQLTTELRCLVCQNQNIAESNADLAKDIRDTLYQQIRSGVSDAQALDFMVERYGEFVLFRPRLRGATLLLWAGPLLFGVAGTLIMRGLVRGIARRPDAQALSDEERERLQMILNETQGSART